MGTRARQVLGGAIGAVLIAVAARAHAAPTAEVQIESFQFAPARLEIAAGAAVVWINRDDEPHTVTSVRGLFASGALEGAKRFSFRFDAPGTYEYHCSLHPHMTGWVVVRAADDERRTR